MGGFFQALAVDLDGTLTEDGTLGPELLQALDQARDHGLLVLLATGRIQTELVAQFPDLLGLVDLAVLENGAVLVTQDGQCRDLTLPVDPALAQALAERGVGLRAGRCILACHAGDAAVVNEEIARLGLDCHTLRNRDQLMVLPAGTSKGTGLRAALDRIGVSPHNTIAVGDAENDLALLEVAEIAVAVANAVPSVRAHADLCLEHPDGRGVAELLRGPVLAGTSVIHPARHGVRIGTAEDGSPVVVPGAQASVLIHGQSGTGKSFLAGLLVERWSAAGYSVLVVDPEGDHLGLGHLPNLVVVDGGGMPDVAHLLRILRQQQMSVVLDLSGQEAGRRGDYLHTLATAIASARAVHGTPHWVVVDEAHGFSGDGAGLTELFRPHERGYCLITYRPEHEWSPPLTHVDVTLTALGRQRPEPGREGRATAWCRVTGAPGQLVTLDRRATPHVRHLHKYAATTLPEQRRFVFRDADGHPLDTAASISEFAAILERVDLGSVEHHLLCGDFSRWLLAVLQDPELGALVSAVESELLARLAGDAQRARLRIVDALTRRYLAPETGADAGPPG